MNGHQRLVENALGAIVVALLEKKQCEPPPAPGGRRAVRAVHGHRVLPRRDGAGGVAGQRGRRRHPFQGRRQQLDVSALPDQRDDRLGQQQGLRSAPVGRVRVDGGRQDVQRAGGVERGPGQAHVVRDHPGIGRGDGPLEQVPGRGCVLEPSFAGGQTGPGRLDDERVVGAVGHGAGHPLLDQPGPDQPVEVLGQVVVGHQRADHVPGRVVTPDPDGRQHVEFRRIEIVEPVGN